MEWAKAQEISFSVDLSTATKKHLQFLAVVESKGCLYEGPALERAIRRYKNCWLPLLAKHTNCQLFDGPLVVPLDCEWIWHCHRLNPVQYGRDCKKIYGKILGNLNVLSSVEEASPEQTKSSWERIYLTEPYNLDLSNLETLITNNGVDGKAHNGMTIEYDLVDAVKRQSSFFKKVSKRMNYDDDLMKEAVGRYKGFNHLINMTHKKQMKPFCVPTLDIDLIWHTHQLHPLSYFKDMEQIHGHVLDHNDRDSKGVEGQKKMTHSFDRTKQLWEVLFGNDYELLPLPKKKYAMECFHTCTGAKVSENAPTSRAKYCFYTCGSKSAENATDSKAEYCFYTCGSKATEIVADSIAEYCFYTCGSKATENVTDSRAEYCFYTCGSKVSEDVPVNENELFCIFCRASS